MTNEGTLDRTIRIVLGLGILSLALVGPQPTPGYLGLVPLLTGLVGCCPLCRLVGLSTCAPSKT